MSECFVCKKEFGASRHIYACAKKHGLSLDKQEIKYKQICHTTEFDFTSDYMHQKYTLEEWSLPDFKKTHGLPYKSTMFLLDFFHVPKRSIGQATLSSRTRDKYKKTCVEKYGVENASQSNIVKRKKEETFKEHYGTNNIWKSKAYYRWLHQHMMEKFGKKSLPNRYGGMSNWWKLQTKEYRKAVGKQLRMNYLKWYDSLTDEQRIIHNQSKAHEIVSRNTSSLESRVSALFSKMGIPFIHQFWVNCKSYDFRIQGTRSLLEINGDFWHANPSIYLPDDLLSHPEGKKPASAIWEKDQKKKENAERYGYKVVVLWESEMKVSDEELLVMLTEILNNAID
jgi:G:T-mismatch repair DNA endonuclease (very short patch repair protein)